jgi:hypothetical protein
MKFLAKLGRAAKFLGQKASNAASYLGNKLGDGLLKAAPFAALVNPSIGAGVAGAGAVAKGVGALGDAGKHFLGGGGLDSTISRGKDAVGQMKGGVSDIRTAYRDLRSGYNNLLERSDG